MWAVVRDGRLGYKFRRQHPIGNYIADLCFPQASLVIELDGPIHDDQEADDLVRQEFIEGRESCVLRLANDDVVNRLSAVLTVIDAALNKGTS